jgi:curli biogenesis system outer membrane secretion channel CsgG
MTPRFIRQLLFAGLVATTPLAFQGCASVDKSSAKAQEGSPESAQVEIVSVPYDPSLPTFLVAVENLGQGASGRTSGGGYDWWGPGSQVGDGVTAQLKTALTRAGNIALVDIETLIRKPDGTYEALNMQEGEVGPFIIRGMVTEFNETAEAVEKGRGGSGARLGWFMEWIGGRVGSPTVRDIGTGTGIADPTYENREAKRSGMVALDLQLYDGRTGRISRGYTASGTFTSVSAKSGVSAFGIGGDDSAFASSALGQATRAAMNQAVLETVAGLKNVRR